MAIRKAHISNIIYWSDFKNKKVILMVLSHGEHNEKMKIFGIKIHVAGSEAKLVYMMSPLTSSNLSHLSPQKHIGIQTKIDHLKMKQAKIALFPEQPFMLLS
jgi:hypothetical protein